MIIDHHRRIAFTIRVSKDKIKVRKHAKRVGRKVLWMDDKGMWHAAIDRNNTPHYAVETEDV